MRKTFRLAILRRPPIETDGLHRAAASEINARAGRRSRFNANSFRPLAAIERFYADARLLSPRERGTRELYQKTLNRPICGNHDR